MSDNFYSRGAEDRKPVSLQELHKARFGIVTLASGKRDRSRHARSQNQRGDAVRTAGASTAVQ